MDDSSLRTQIYDKNPSSEEFASRIEPNNVPVVFRGCITNWEAYSKWNPTNGGLNYLQERAGSLNVEAMLSRSAPIFNGDIRSHERVPLAFSTFIGYCNDVLGTEGDLQDPSQLNSRGLVESYAEQSDLMHDEAPQQIYLAQVPILNTENDEKVQLGCLREDIQTPPFLETKELASINLWMNSVQTRSTTHYDPHHNLLCIVAGSKQVYLWPPSAMPVLYPQPIYGEASNHSSISLESPDLSLYPKAQHASDFSQKLTLHAGDALFIPEGWFHQVNSDCLTIAVNFWWQSGIMSAMISHMDAYYLRRILSRLTGQEMVVLDDGVVERLYIYEPSIGGLEAVSSYVEGLSLSAEDVGGSSDLLYSGQNQMLCMPSVMQVSESSPLSKHHNGDADRGGNDLEPLRIQTKQKTLWPELDPLAAQSLGQLISLVYEHVDNIEPISSATEDNTVVGETIKTKNFVTELSLVDDPIANFVWNLDPLILQTILLAMAKKFPRTLEALVLHSLSPVGAEVLTRKLEEMDKMVTEEERNQFYQTFYGVFDDQSAAMDALLNGKELFARQAYRNVLTGYLGLDFNDPQSSSLTSHGR